MVYQSLAITTIFNAKFLILLTFKRPFFESIFYFSQILRFFEFSSAMEVEFSNFYAYYDNLAALIDEQTWEAAERAAVLLCCRDKHAELKFLQVG